MIFINRLVFSCIESHKGVTVIETEKKNHLMLLKKKWL
jgi:hypothetical protein